MATLTGRLYQILDLFTLRRLFRLLHYCNENHTFLHIFHACLNLLEIFFLFRVLFAFYCIEKNLYSWIEYYEPYFHTYSTKQPQQDKLLMWSITSNSFQLLILIHCVLLKFYKHFSVTLLQTQEWMLLWARSKYTILDCSIGFVLCRNMERNRTEFVDNFCIAWDPFYTKEDVKKIARLLKILDFLYFYSVCNLLCMANIGFSLLAMHYMGQSDCKLISFKMLRFVLDIFSTIILRVVSGSVIIALSLNFFYLYLKILYYQYHRVVTMICQQRYETKSRAQQRRVLKMLFYGRQLFVFTLKHYRKIDRFAISNCFTYTVIFALICNTIPTVQVLNYGIASEMFIIIAVIITWAFVIILFMFHALSQSTVGLYSMSKPFCWNYVHYTKCSALLGKSLSLNDRLKLNFFVEIVHTRKQFHFKLATFGKIKDKKTTFISFLPLYTAFILHLLTLMRN